MKTSFFYNVLFFVSSVQCFLLQLKKQDHFFSKMYSSSIRSHSEPQPTLDIYEQRIRFPHDVKKWWSFSQDWYVHYLSNHSIGVLHWNHERHEMIPIFCHGIPTTSSTQTFIVDVDFILQRTITSHGTLSLYPKLLVTLYDACCQKYCLVRFDKQGRIELLHDESPLRFCKWMCKNRFLCIYLNGNIVVYTCKDDSHEIVRHHVHHFSQVVHQVFVMDDFVFVCGHHGLVDCLLIQNQTIQSHLIDLNIGAHNILHITMSREPISISSSKSTTNSFLCTRLSVILNTLTLPLITFLFSYYPDGTWTCVSEQDEVWCGPLCPWNHDEKISPFVYPFTECNYDLSHVQAISGILFYMFSTTSPLARGIPLSKTKKNIWVVHIRSVGPLLTRKFTKQRWFFVHLSMTTKWAFPLVLFPTFTSSFRDWTCMTYRQLYDSSSSVPYLEKKIIESDDEEDSFFSS